MVWQEDRSNWGVWFDQITSWALRWLSWLGKSKDLGIARHTFQCHSRGFPACKVPLRSSAMKHKIGNDIFIRNSVLTAITQCLRRWDAAGASMVGVANVAVCGFVPCLFFLVPIPRHIRSQASLQWPVFKGVFPTTGVLIWSLLTQLGTTHPCFVGLRATCLCYLRTYVGRIILPGTCESRPGNHNRAWFLILFPSDRTGIWLSGASRFFHLKDGCA